MKTRHIGTVLTCVTFLSATPAGAAALHFNLGDGGTSARTVELEASEGGVTATFTGLRNYHGGISVEQLMASTNNPFATITRDQNGFGVSSGRAYTQGHAIAHYEGILVQFSGAPNGVTLESLVLHESGDEREPFAIFNSDGEQVYGGVIGAGGAGHSNQTVNFSKELTGNAFILISTVHQATANDRGFKFRSLIASYEPQSVPPAPTTDTSVSAVPIPGALGFLAFGIGGLVYAARRKRG